MAFFSIFATFWLGVTQLLTTGSVPSLRHPRLKPITMEDVPFSLGEGLGDEASDRTEDVTRGSAGQQKVRGEMDAEVEPQPGSS